MTSVFSVLLILTVAWWVRVHFGALAALITAVLGTFDPTLLAHGHYIASDLPVSLFYFAATVAWLSWLEGGGFKRLLFTGLLTGLALATKFSALLLFPTFVVLWFFKRRQINWQHGICMVLIPFVLVWATYGFDVRPPDADPRIGSKLATRALAHIPIPGYYFLRGIHLLLRHARSGPTAYFMGTLIVARLSVVFPGSFSGEDSIGLLLIVGSSVIFSDHSESNEEYSKDRRSSSRR